MSGDEELDGRLTQLDERVEELSEQLAELREQKQRLGELSNELHKEEKRLSNAMSDTVGCIFIYAPLYFLGMCVAVASSWQERHSVLWSSVDGILSWAYVLWHFWLASQILNH